MPTPSLWIDASMGLRRFKEDQRGNVVILFALALVPILGLTGLGVDFSMTLRLKTAMDASVDAAVLAAATDASQVLQTLSTSSRDATAQAIASGTETGRRVFLSNSALLKTTEPATFSLTLQRQDHLITASGSYSVRLPTVFGTMFGTPNMMVSGAATSHLDLPKFMNIYVATDISQSMGIAATQNDMDRLSALTSGCVFGCHVTAPGQSRTNEDIAHSNGVELRIDVIKDAIKNIISSAKSQAGSVPTISIGLYTLQEDIPSDNAHLYNKITAPITDYDQLTTLANAIELGNNDSGGTGDTNFDQAMPLFTANEVPTSGDGSSATSKQNFVFLMTDGVQDTKGGGCTYGHCTKAFDPALCSTLKSKGVKVGVIYTTYIPFPNEDAYMRLVYPFQPQIAPNLRACASPGYYYEASDGPAIRTAVNALFAQAVSTGWLSQ